MKAKLIHKSEYYDTLLEWWTQHKAFHGKIIDYDMMPNRLFIVSKDGEDLFAVSVYVSDSTVCWIGWITSNPNANLRSKHGALDFLYDFITETMTEHGYKCIISKTNERGLIKALENSNFLLTEKTNFYIKNI